ncbi:reprolysin-like metallopeptidase [Flavobacterium pedocola]
MKRNLLLTLAAFALSSGYAQSDKFWSAYKGDAGKIATDKGVARLTFPKDFDLYSLNLGSLRETLFSLQNKSTNQKVIISLPNADGKLEQFEMYEASNFEADLQAQFPEIRAYSGKGITDPYATLKLSISPQGIQTMVFRTDKANEFMEPYSQNHEIYAVYKSQRDKGQLNWTCSTDDKQAFTDISGKIQNVAKSSTGQLKTMRLAQSCTAEYSNYFGATSAAQVNLVLAAFNNTLTRCNGVYEKDLGLHLNLVAASTNVIYYTAGTDPYSDAATGSGGAWNAELQNTLSSSLTGPSTSLAANNAAYDIGHLFGASGGGGNAGCIGCVCDDDTASTTDKKKGSGFTSPGDGIPQGDNFDIDYVVHEVGHQLGGNHTFSHASEGSGVNMEVGSGVTIMGYAGITNYDFVPHSIDAYHAASIAQIQANLAGRSCPVTTAISANNATPVALAGADYTIPKSTPFMLTGSATDANAGDALTYSWEQYDDVSGQTAANSGASAGKTAGPNWRTFAPTASPTRYFPTMSTVLAGLTATPGIEVASEALSSVARTLNFRLTVRDNAPFSSSAPIKVGQTNFDNMVVTVDATRGPLTVTSQNTDGISWNPGQTQTITWAVNNTNTSTGGTNVDILLSTDNGATFGTVLVANTPNDGSETITVPSTLAPYCRVMVKASGSIFFNVNVKSFAIGYIVTTTTTCTDYTRTFSPAQAMATGWTGYTIPAITDSYTISDANFKIVCTAARTNQVSFGLVKPGSSVVDYVAFDGPTSGCGNAVANMNVVFDDEGAAFSCANTNSGAAYRPVSSFATLDGMNSAGTWRLAAKSTVTTNTITSATLTLCHTDTTITLASESFGLENFSIYPNPNKGNFNVQFTSNSSNEIKIGVHDMRGRLVFENDFQNTGTFNQNIALSNVQAGIYVVTVQDGERKEVKKIVIE